jgi:hypothetical protein
VLLPAASAFAAPEWGLAEALSSKDGGVCAERLVRLLPPLRTVRKLRR